MLNSKSLLESDRNLWLFLKMELYGGSKGYAIKADVRELIKTIMSEIEPVEVKIILINR